MKPISLKGFNSHNAVQFVTGGKSFFDCLETQIDNARSSIHLQTYIFQGDETGTTIANALMRAASRGVNVHLLADGYASQDLPDKLIEQMKNAGIHFRYFEPLLKSKHYYFGRRLHHKVFVADSKYALVGGINISDSYNDRPGRKAWFDFALLVEGEIAHQLCLLCWKTWFAFEAQKENEKSRCLPFHADHNKENFKTLVRIRRNDWLRRRNQISRNYKEIFRHAEKEITIVSSYFLPGRIFRKNLERAVKRGVKIRVMLAGVSDVGIAKQAERHLYRWLFRNKVDVFEYVPCVLHGKMAICDNEWLTLGSFNINNLSAFISIELNLDVHNEDFVSTVKQSILDTISKDCVPITADRFAQRNNFFQRLWQHTCYFMLKALFVVFTFYYKQRE